jgi:hypothetical protein
MQSGLQQLLRRRVATVARRRTGATATKLGMRWFRVAAAAATKCNSSGSVLLRQQLQRRRRRRRQQRQTRTARFASTAAATSSSGSNGGADAFPFNSAGSLRPPMIQFRHGVREAAPSAADDGFVFDPNFDDDAFLDTPPELRARQFTQYEMDLVEMGGAEPY